MMKKRDFSSSSAGRRKSESKGFSPKKPKFSDTVTDSNSTSREGKKKFPFSPKDYQSAKPNFQLVENLKSDWNKVRVKTLNVAERNKLMNKIAERVKGKILQITLRHDVSRIVQSIVQFGSNELRSSIVKEISNKVLDISKTPCKLKIQKLLIVNL